MNDYDHNRLAGAGSENHRLRRSCINWRFVVNPRLANSDRTSVGNINNRGEAHMTIEFPFGHLLSGLAKSLHELVTRCWTENCLPRFNDFLEKLKRTSKQLRRRFADRAAAGMCDECSRIIRPWDSRVSVTEHTSIHRSCWESRQFFIGFVHQQSLVVRFQTPALLRALALIESIVRSFYDEVQRKGTDTPQSEYIRGMLNGARSMLTELRDQATKEQILSEARRRVGKPLPSALPLAEDGNRYGWDIEAEAGSP